MPESIKAYDSKAFEGKWVLSRVSANDIVMDAVFLPYANFDLKFGIEIKQGVASIALTLSGSSVQWDSNLTFSDGLLLLDKDNSIISKEIRLLNSGELSVTISDMTLLLEKEEKNMAGWKCPTCGQNASGNFCSNCGTAYSASAGVSATTKSVSAKINKTLNTGTYRIGEDIPAGTYTITCIEVEDYLGKSMDALGGLADLLDDETGDAYRSYFELLGGLVGEPEMTVHVVDSAGYTVKSSELKQGESVTLQLKSGATLHISDGKCSLVAQ